MTNGSTGPAGYGQPAARRAAAFLMSAADGTRVVARYRIPGGFTDALGYIDECDGTDCVIRTRRGQVRVPLSAVVAAKQVPDPPPSRRS